VHSRHHNIFCREIAPMRCGKHWLR